MPFPNDFLRGAATSAFQYEGAASEGGKGWTTADERCRARATRQADASVAVDGYHHWEEDVELMRELGLKTYRFSVSWARVIPDGDGKVNEEGIAYYRKVLEALTAAHIVPVVTLLHFDVPFALVEKYGGFVDRRAADAFERFARVCFDRLGDLVGYWITINEQNVMASIPDMCGIALDDPDAARKLASCDYHMFLASAKAVIACHEMLPGVPIGPDVSYAAVLPYTCEPADVNAAFDLQERLVYHTMETYAFGTINPLTLRRWEQLGIDELMLPGDDALLRAGSADFFGVNWYCTSVAKGGDDAADSRSALNMGGDFMRLTNPYLEYTDWGWSYDPAALRIALKECWARFHLPLMICENGWSEREELEDGEVHDPKRIEYLRDHAASMEQAIEEGVDLIGYQYWSFVDILSSSDGCNKRYGLVFVDRTDDDPKECARIKKDSFWYYRQLIASNGTIR